MFAYAFSVAFRCPIDEAFASTRTNLQQFVAKQMQTEAVAQQSLHLARVFRAGTPGFVL